MLPHTLLELHSLHVELSKINVMWVSPPSGNSWSKAFLILLRTSYNCLLGRFVSNMVYLFCLLICSCFYNTGNGIYLLIFNICKVYIKIIIYPIKWNSSRLSFVSHAKQNNKKSIHPSVLIKLTTPSTFFTK